MVDTPTDGRRWPLPTVWRIGWAVVSIVVVQGVVCGLAALPVVLAWMQLDAWMTTRMAVRAAVFSLILVPSYIAFALSLMVLSAAATRLTGAHTPADNEMRIADMGWPLMKWAQLAIHVCACSPGPCSVGHRSGPRTSGSTGPASAAAST